MTVQAPERPDREPALLARLDQLRQAERRAASARMVSVIGHMIGTPLNVIAGRAALIRTNAAPEAVNENVRRIEEQVERLSQRIRRLIDYFGLVDATPDPRPLLEVLAESVALYGPVAAEKGISIEVRNQDVGSMRIDHSVSQLVLTTLLSLAMRTTPAGGAVSISAVENGSKTVLFELGLPGVAVPPNRVDRLEPPEHGVLYDADAMEVLSICLGLARRGGGGLDVQPAANGAGVMIRFECAYTA
jgi:two-component system NtrC family sensor kinase